MFAKGALIAWCFATGAFFAEAAPNSDCKCSPNDSCWPATSAWASLNQSVSGQLVRNVQVAAPCYTGPYYNPTQCANVKARWTDSYLHDLNPIGYSYPHTQHCDIPGGNTTTCSIGDSPIYSVNATVPAHVETGVNFARKNNLRLVIKTTGHDLIGRSTGAGSFEIWLRHLRTGIEFQKVYEPRRKCSSSKWTGSALTVGGGYQWVDVYPVALANHVVVVGGGCPSVSALGGYLQGGGHSLASHDYGLAADQLLEATVVLASGSIVTASACENSDLFKALRGGAGGTYGIIIYAVIKAHPQVTVTSQALSITSLTDANLPQYMEALNILYQAFPSLVDGGLSGYGNWMAYSPTSPSYISSSLGASNQTKAQVEKLFAPTAAKLAKYNGTSLYISANYTTWATYYDYYYGTNGVNSAAETEAAIVSRLLGKTHLANITGLAHMLNVSAGTPDQYIYNEFSVIGGGAVLDASDTNSGVNPSWRQTYLIELAAHGWSDTADYATQVAAHHDITFVKGGAMTALAPDMGSYMNEGDWQDPNYLLNYYGGALPGHDAAKKKYDPSGVFYCPTCVGSEKWVVTSEGKLCSK